VTSPAHQSHIRQINLVSFIPVSFISTMPLRRGYGALEAVYGFGSRLVPNEANGGGIAFLCAFFGLGAKCPLGDTAFAI
jgi:hypothetical protein